MAPRLRRVAIPWFSLQRFYTTCYKSFDPAPLGGIRHCLRLRSSGLANTSTSAPNVCLSEPSLFGNADLKASAGAPRQSRSRQHPIPLAVRSRSDIMRTLPCKREPWDAKPCPLPSERAKPVSSWSGACLVPSAFDTREDLRLAYRQFKGCHPQVESSNPAPKVLQIEPAH